MSKSNAKVAQNKLGNVPVKTIVKVVTEVKSPKPKQEIKTGSQAEKSNSNSTKTTNPSMKPSLSSSNLTKESKIKQIITTNNPAENVVKDLMKVTDVDSNVNIEEVDHDDKIKTVTERVREKSKEPIAKPAANTKLTASPTPAESTQKGRKPTIISKTGDTASKVQGILKRDSTNNLSSSSTILTGSKTLISTPSSKSVSIKILEFLLNL